MGAPHRARGIAAALLLALTGLACRDTAGPAGVGRIAPTAAAFAVVPQLGVDDGEPEIPLRQARIRLFRLPGRTPEVAALDTLIPFGERDEESITLSVALTMANERFTLELALIDDRGDVVYLGRDTVIAYARGKPPAAEPFRLRYAGPDTAVARITLEPRDTVLLVGDELALRASAYLGDGRTTAARFGFVVRGSSALTVDARGVVRATAPAAARTAWVVARTATGLADSVAVEVRRVPAIRVEIAPRGGRLRTGDTLALTADARDARGEVLPSSSVVWSSLSPGVASVDAGGIVRALAHGHARIVAGVDGVADSVQVDVLP